MKLYRPYECRQSGVTCHWFTTFPKQSERTFERTVSAVGLFYSSSVSVKVAFKLPVARCRHIGRAKGMLHRAWQHSCLSKVVSFKVFCPRVLLLCLSRGGTPASLHSGLCFVGVRDPMQTFRQRRTSDRIAARCHTTQSAKGTSDSLGTLQPTPAEPAAKKRKTSAVKPTSKCRKDHSTSQHQAVAPAAHADEATSSADTSFDATPALTSVPSGIPANVPAHVPADPNVLHCWTKASMAQAAAHLAEQDPG